MKKIALITFILLVVTACGGTVPPPPTGTIPPTLPPATETPAPTATPLPPPTETAIPPTPKATKTPLRPTVEGFPLFLPVGEPLSAWNGIPIMPGAIQGEESGSDGYIFTIQSSIEEIQDFYLTELPKVGWQSLGIGEGENGNVLIIFTGEKGTLTVGILVVDEAESLYLVMMVES